MRTSAIKIVADENMAALDELFADVADIKRVNGRELTSSDLTGADALLVRSVSRVDESLLAGSSVQFVGSATIGTDHIDLEYLSKSGINFCHAPGSNADSVADYCCSALAAIVPELGRISGNDLRAGIIGLGEVGSRLALRLQALGYQVCAYDPFLDSAQFSLCSLEEVLSCDVLSLNVPLTFNGKHPTRHMLGADSLSAMSSKVILINTSRGEVIDGLALKQWMLDRPGVHAVLDVWEQEPRIDRELASLVSIGTPHIAGYAVDGKVRGTSMLASKFRDHFSLASSSSVFSVPPTKLCLSGKESLNEVLLQAYDIRDDDQALRMALKLVQAQLEISTRFDGLRKNYPQRREYGAIELEFANPPSEQMQHTLGAMGFPLSQSLLE